MLARPRFRLAAPALACGGCLAALAALSALSMAWADDAGRAFVAAVRVAGYAGTFAAVAAWAPRTRRRDWIAGLAVGSTAIAVGALASRFDPALFGGGDRSLQTVLPSTIGRLSYPIGYWNGLGAALAIGASILAWFGSSSPSRRVRALSVGLLPAYGLALYLTSSRAAVAATALGLAILLGACRPRVRVLAATALGLAGAGALIALAHGMNDLLDGADTSSGRVEGAQMAAATLAVGVACALARDRADRFLDRLPRPSRLPRRIALPLAAVLLVGALVAVHPSARFDEFKRADFGGSTAAPGQRSLLSSGGSGRYQFWGAALDAYASRPVEGLGAGNFGLYWSAHPGGPVPIQNAHSLYLETLAELGPVGLALVFGFLAVPAIVGARRARRAAGGDLAVAVAIIGAGALSAALDWTFQIPASFAPVVVAAALVVGWPPAAADLVANRGRIAARLGGPAFAALAWLGLWSAVVAFGAAQLLSASSGAALRGDLAAAAADARHAAALAPFSVEPALQLAVVEQAGGDLADARSQAGRAIDLAPGDYRGWLVAARIDAARGAGGWHSPS